MSENENGNSSQSKGEKTRILKHVKKKRSDSLLVGYLNRFTALIYALFSEAIPGRFLSSPERLYKDGVIGRVLYHDSSEKSKNRRAKIANTLENGAAARVVSKIGFSMLTMSINVYGVFFMFYGISSFLVNGAILFMTGEFRTGMGDVLPRAAIILCSLPFVVSKGTACSILRNGRFGRFLAFKYLCIPEDELKHDTRLGGTAYLLISSTLGLALGIPTYKLHLMYMPAIFLVLVSVFVILASPEAGVIIGITLIPFLQSESIYTLILIFIIAMTSISYILKVMRGKRVVRISTAGIFVLLYVASLLISGLFNNIGQKAVVETLVISFVLMGVFFTSYNLMRSEKRVDVCLKVIVFSVVLISFSEILKFVYNGVSGGLAYSLKNNLGYAVSGSEIYIKYSSEVFGLLSAMSAPLIISKCFSQKRIYGVLSVILSFVCVLYGMTVNSTFETVVAFVAGIAIFLVVRGHKSLTVILAAICPVIALYIAYPYFVSYLPMSVGELLAKFLPGSGEMSAYRSEIITSVWNMLKDGHLSGIGVGNYAFGKFFGEYSNSVSTDFATPGNLYMQILCWSGVLGFLIFFSFIFAFIKVVFGYATISTDKKRKSIIVALFCGVISSLFLGLSGCIWSDLRSFYIFWFIAGLTLGYAEDGIDREKQRYARMGSTPYNTDIEI